MAGSPIVNGKYHDAPEVAVSNAPEHVANPDFGGEKVYVGHEVDSSTLPQLANTTVNTDPRSYPQAVNTLNPEVNKDPKSFPQVVGGGDDEKKDKPMAAVPGAEGASPSGVAGRGGESGSKRHWWHKKKLLAIIAALVLVIIGLVIGLAVGLTKNNNNGDSGDNGNGGGNSGGNQGSPGTGAGDSNSVSCDGGLCPPVLSASSHDGELAVFARTAAGRIAVRTHDGETWDSAWVDLNDTESLISQPGSISWDVDGEETPRLDVFAVSSSNDVLSRHKIDAEGTWSSQWEKIGSSAGSPVQACRPRDDRIDLWVTDASSYNITHNWWVQTSTEARRKRQDDDDENEPDENDDDDSGVQGNWNSFDAWEALSLGPAASAPAVVCRDTTTYHDIVWYDRNEQQMWHAQFNQDNSNAWSSPRSFDGDFIGSPLLVSFATDSFMFFGVQSNNDLYTFTWTESSGSGSYSSMTGLSGSLASVPAVISPADDIVDVVALSTDGQIIHQHYNGTRWASDWETLDVKALSAPTVASHDGLVWVFTLSSEGQLQASSLDASDGPAEWSGSLQTENLGGELDLEYYLTE